MWKIKRFGLWKSLVKGHLTGFETLDKTSKIKLKLLKDLKLEKLVVKHLISHIQASLPTDPNYLILQNVWKSWSFVTRRSVSSEQQRRDRLQGRDEVVLREDLEDPEDHVGVFARAQILTK